MFVNIHSWMSGFWNSITRRATALGAVTLGGSTFRRQRRRTGAQGAALESRTLLSAFVVDSALDNTTVDGLTTLREAIILANGSAGPHTITFGDGSGSGGTNFTDGVADTITLSLGQMAISQSVTITGLSAARTIINGNNASRIFSITRGDTTLEKLTLTGGKTATNNAAGAGGAIRSTSSGTLTMSQSTLSGNSTTGIGARGGAIFASFGAVTVSQSTLSGNFTTGVAALGGAIYAIAGAVTVSQSTLSGNSTVGVSADGGAIVAGFGAVTVSQSTLTGNHVNLGQGGGIFSVASPVTIQNSIVAGNTDDGTAPDVRQSPSDALTVSRSLIGDNTGTDLTEAQTADGSGNFIGSSTGGGIIDPLLGTLQNNGGSTFTHAVRVGSLALNSGDNTLIPLDSLDLDINLNTAEQVPFDQRGVGFARIDGGTVDMGAFERDTTVPTVAITLSDTALSLSETLQVTFVFSEAVTGFDNTDLTIANGTLTAVTSGDGGVTWTATFTPTAGIHDATNRITVDMTQITDLAGNTGVGNTSSNNYAIDTQPPTVTIVVSDSTLLVGETSLVTFTFTEAVTGFTNSNLSIPNGTLTAVTSADGGVTWTATFTPTADIQDATNRITVDQAPITDLAGNAGVGSTGSPNYVIDTLRPTVVITMSDTTLTAGETSLVTFTFSEAVTSTFALFPPR